MNCGESSSSPAAVGGVSFADARHSVDREKARWRAHRAGRVARAPWRVRGGARARLSDGGVLDGHVSARTRSRRDGGAHRIDAAQRFDVRSSRHRRSSHRQALHRWCGRQGVARAGAAGSRGGNRRADDVGARTRAHRWNARQAGCDPGLSQRSFDRARACAAGAGRMRAPGPDRRDRAGGPEALLAARRDRHGGVDSAHRGPHPAPAAGGRTDGPGARCVADWSSRS